MVTAPATTTTVDETIPTTDIWHHKQTDTWTDSQTYKQADRDGDRSEERLEAFPYTGLGRTWLADSNADPTFSRAVYTVGLLQRQIPEAS